ncbi:serine hydrolase [Longimicrobium terrae]|uniref:CubicO group peptidase (Beta-lactamase class C family)/beta-glucosidase-like glycosyl hydrolase n=1 Tax=Longimicrobium terrae TaxID=1639882 RepID=A0A841GXN7_9BACT|nr:serine hydrolase [Longimicrobium terrae]MBB4636120.1 CubicO group peptidase (beta-lactamase class C family)/beta-glucosidase-like glycosyl hydrolase [Longimicrobium terrae]MBB6070515.1 CubicO group peptidase (beta-lactamase class C family)/beta-glucosidase-like glycosyl hydrolase [Longimicrobium terrae]NNC29505.1 serine hydrolase [Longimicrobium terrae]
MTRIRPSALAAALLALLAAGCRQAETSPWSEDRLARMELRARVAQMLAPAVYVGADARAVADTALARRFAQAGVGGVRLLPGTLPVAERRLGAIQRASRLPLLVIADLDRGVGGALAGASELPPPLSLGTAEGERVDAAAAQASAEAGRLGINFALLTAPSFPYPTALPAPWGAGADSAFVRYARQLSAGGMLVGVRALSAGPEARDGGPPILDWDRAAVDGLQLGLMRGLVAAGVAGIKPASIAIPSLTRDTVPLPDNAVFTQGVLRRDLGFDGLILEDLAPVTPLVRRYGAQEAAVRAVAAGADLLVGVDDVPGTVDAIVRAVETGRISPSRVEAAVRHVFAAKERLRLGMADTASARPDSARAQNPRAAADSAFRGAVAAHRAALLVMGQVPATTLRGCRTTVLVTAPGIAARPLSVALAGRIRGLTHLQTPRLPRRGPLVPRAVDYAGRDADCVIAAAFPGARPAVLDRLGSAGAWPDSAARAALSPDSLARLARDTVPRRIVWIDFFPGAEAAAPAARSLLVVRGVGPAAQQAAAEAVLSPSTRAGVPSGGAWPAARTLRVAAPDSAEMKAARLASIDTILRNGIRDSVFSAAAVVVARRGMVVKMSGYGQTGGEPVDPRGTLFDLASLSKVVGTTPAAMVMVDDGAISLGAPVRRYIPEFRGGNKADVTVRHLLTHTSGLPAGDWLYNLSSSTTALNRVIRSELVRAPGSGMEYSDFGMILMAESIHRVSREPLDRLVARRVFGPLGMVNTQYLPPSYDQARTVPTAVKSERPYVVDGVVHDANAYRLGGVAGHAGLFSTAWDVSIYAQTLLNGGAYGTRRVFREQTVRSWTRRQPNADTRGLGWDTPGPRSSAGSYMTARAYGHTGFTGTSMWMDPELDLFVVLLTNRTYREGSQGALLRIRAAVADAAALSITDRPVPPRAGTAAAIEAARPKVKPRRPAPRRPARRPTRPARRRG